MARVLASEPFVEGYGDIILRSCDGVDFHVSKCIVLVVSPIFRDMFSLPDSPAANRYEGVRPVIDMQEDSSVLDTLLRFCYPVEPPEIPSKHDFERIAATAQKFEMQSVYGRIVDSYISDNIVHPLEQYILAHRFKLHQLAIDSAEKCLDYSLSELVGQARSPDLTYLSANDYNWLLQYHQEYFNACTRLVNGRDFSWCNAEQYAFVVCPCADNDEIMDVDVDVGGERGSATVSWKKWWFNHVSRIEEAMKARGPTAVNYIDVSQAAADVIASGCQRCRDAAIVELHDFGKALRWEVKNEKSNASLEIYF
ncbi:hypothetical protein BDN71DRAFT_1449127 [Pleurotus eryngii]|uniref:BTB domain-containing protein n=1 Tax=Pleurotus eryngii TaxID=5323 RepID=A0A9P5ZX01_PLEER|nr:hypothetical protein BDN71DRAFT_1449127 [Pleurotus eryngii]